jgi:hypothetical protein
MNCDKTLVQNPYYQVESVGLTPYNRHAEWINLLKVEQKRLFKSGTWI